MKNPLLMPYWEFFGFPAFGTVKTIKQAGFQGIEILLSRNLVPCRITNTYRQLCLKLGLILHFHECWTLEDNPTYGFNKALAALGIIHKTGFHLAAQIPTDMHEPMVIYPDRYNELLQLGSPPTNLWLQTVHVMNGSLQHKLSYPKFVTEFHTHHFPIVFDTQHFLEYRCNVNGVEELPRDPQMLTDLLIEGWDTFESQVREVHLSDCDPELGHSRGTKVFLGDGILPLRDFCQYIKRQRYEGFITPEVRPPRFTWNSLSELRRTVENLFA